MPSMPEPVKTRSLGIGELRPLALAAEPAPDVAGDLQSQLKQSKPFRSLREEVFLNVVRTATELQAYFAELLRAHDLSSPQYNVLRILRGAGDEGLHSGEIGERMVSRDPDVTRLLDRMERRGLIARLRGTTDRRVVSAHLTGEGRRLVDALDAPVAEMHARRLGHLSEQELRTLSDLLERARGESPAR